MIDYIFDIIRQIRFVEIIEFIGTFAFAISGVRGAATKKCDWFGAFVLGFVTAVGGGTFRDLLLGVTPCIVGGIFFVTLLFFNLNLPLISAITIGIVTFLRYVAVKWDLQIPKLKSEKSN